MSVRRFALGAVAVLAAVVPAVSVRAGAGTDPVVPGDPAHAIYGDRIIDLAQGWQGAGACLELGTYTECYDTMADLIVAHPEAAPPRPTISLGLDVSSSLDGVLSLLVDCGSYVWLYTGTSFGGTSLGLITRNVYHNLSTFGVNNTTSSYTIGACSASFYDGNGGGAPTYPGSTSAGASATSMVAGWDNRVSSVYIF